MKTCSSCTFQQNNDPKHTAKTTQEQLRDKSLNVLEWPSQSPDLKPIEHLWRYLKIAVQRHSNPTLQHLRICKEEWKNLPKYRCAKLVASYPGRLKDVIAAKGASTKNLSKGSEYLCKCDISVYFLFSQTIFIQSNYFCFVIMGYSVQIDEEKYLIHFRIRL